VYSSFLRIAGLLNEQLSVYPLLYGSLGLEKRLSAGLNAGDIDVLIPEKYLKTEWNKLVGVMNADGYRLVDEHEHEFSKGSVTVAYADLEGLTSFAGIDPANVPVIEDGGSRFLLLELSDYLKVYEASSKDGYRKNVKNKQDHIKISLIRKALADER
jgi:hypothetical protein